MSLLSDQIDACCRSIFRRLPQGSGPAVTALAKSYADLSKALVETHQSTHDQTIAVVGATDGPASDAFEHFARQHNVATTRLSEAALDVEAQLEHYALAVTEVRTEILRLFNECVQLKGAACANIIPLGDPCNALGQAQALVHKAVLVEQKLVHRAGELARAISKARVSTHLPKRVSAPHYVFEGGYTHSQFTTPGDVTAMHPESVWHIAKQFFGSSSTLSHAVVAFGNAAAGGADAIGHDDAGKAFGAGFNPSPVYFTTEGRAATDRLSYIGHGLQSMVSRQKDADERARAKLALHEGHLQPQARWTPTPLPGQALAQATGPATPLVG